MVSGSAAEWFNAALTGGAVVVAGITYFRRHAADRWQHVRRISVSVKALDPRSGEDSLRYEVSVTNHGNYPLLTLSPWVSAYGCHWADRDHVVELQSGESAAWVSDPMPVEGGTQPQRGGVTFTDFDGYQWKRNSDHEMWSWGQDSFMTWKYYLLRKRWIPARLRHPARDALWAWRYRRPFRPKPARKRRTADEGSPFGPRHPGEA